MRERKKNGSIDAVVRDARTKTEPEEIFPLKLNNEM